MTEKAAVEIKSAEKTASKRPALGRGIESLLPGPRAVPGTGGAAVLSELHASADGVAQIPLEQIAENPYQTRSTFDEAALRELADSIRANGVLQPVVVRPAKDGHYALIVGERRCRASKLAGKTTIPAIIRQVSDQQAAEMTVVENLQRQDLNCLEQAYAFARLSRDFGLTQEQIGLHTGCSRESVSNYMRLLKLPPAIQQYLRDGTLGFSEARVLLQLANQNIVLHYAQVAVEKKLSVAQLRALIDNANLPSQTYTTELPKARWVDPNVRAIQTELERALGVKVKISDRKGKGSITIEYATLEDFDRVVEMLKGKK